MWPPLSARPSAWACPRGCPTTARSPGAATPGCAGLITGGATFVGGSLHALPFLIGDVDRALTLAYAVVAVELLLIAWIRRRFMQVSLTRSLIQVTLGGVTVATVGVIIGSAA